MSSTQSSITYLLWSTCIASNRYVGSRNHFVRKAALSSSPTNKYYYLVIIYGAGSRLGFFRGADKSWSMLEAEPYSDMIFHQNYLYALSEDADYVKVWDMNNQYHARRISIELEEIDMALPSRIRYADDERFYLVVAQGSLLVVKRFIKGFFNEKGDPYFLESECHGGPDKHPNLIPSRSLHFTVFKFDDKQKICREMKCLPKGVVLFFGANQFMSMEIGNSSVFKEDVIYFTDDSHDSWEDESETDHEGHDSGVFTLKDKHVDWLYENKIENQKSPPTWLLPCISS